MNFRNCLPRTQGVNACRRNAVIKCDVEYCDRKCRIQEFPPKLFGKRKVLMMGMACPEYLEATP